MTQKDTQIQRGDEIVFTEESDYGEQRYTITVVDKVDRLTIGHNREKAKVWSTSEVEEMIENNTAYIERDGGE